MHPVAHFTHWLFEFTKVLVVRQAVAQVFAVVRRSPELQVVQVFMFPAQVAQLTLHTWHEFAEAS